MSDGDVRLLRGIKNFGTSLGGEPFCIRARRRVDEAGDKIWGGENRGDGMPRKKSFLLGFAERFRRSPGKCATGTARGICVGKRPVLGPTLGKRDFHKRGSNAALRREETECERQNYRPKQGKRQENDRGNEVSLFLKEKNKKG